MATFGKATFDTAVYASFRPTYPKQLFDFIFRYHEGQRGARWDTAVDLGCGTGTSIRVCLMIIMTYLCKGQATTELTPFKRVVGVDSSAKMIAAARESAASNPSLMNSENVNQFEYVEGDAENLVFEDGSVDLLIAGLHMS